MPSWELRPEEIGGPELRDPFLPFAPGQTPSCVYVPGPQYPVLLSHYTIDQLRLIAVISGTGPKEAMVVDPSGVGTIVRRGDYLARPEVIAPFLVASWRVDRIRRDEIVLVREHPNGAPTARTISLEAGVERKLAPAAPKSSDLASAKVERGHRA